MLGVTDRSEVGVSRILNGATAFHFRLSLIWNDGRNGVRLSATVALSESFSVLEQRQDRR